ncbi:MAG: phosphoribosylanthranilate isomerase [Myxococcota bacterium]
MTRVKVCCIGSVEEARLAVRMGASALGLVSEMPSGTGVIPESRIAEIAARVPPSIATFLLTSRTDAGEIVAQQRRCGVNTIQLCDRVSESVHRELRRACAGTSIVQVVHVTGADAVDEARRVSEHVDALLLDSGDPSLPVKELGGTGRVHDWSVSARIVRAVPVPVFLAGGLRASNAAAAIREVEPFGVDLCTGVRTDGALDETKLEAFFAAVATASGRGGSSVD